MNSPAHEIDTSVHADEGAGVHVADHAIVLDRKITSQLRTARMPRMRRCAMGGHCCCTRENAVCVCVCERERETELTMRWDFGKVTMVL